MKRTAVVIALSAICVVAVFLLLYSLYVRYPALVLDLEAIPVTGR